ncbi:MAG: hypothetical protein IJY66_03865, partial [Clostridia bacterium]|nr:hypothetical protein [Clostridia bacterium]
RKRIIPIILRSLQHPVSTPKSPEHGIGKRFSPVSPRFFAAVRTPKIQKSSYNIGTIILCHGARNPDKNSPFV